MTPEEKARQQIDLLLQQAGWIIQDRSQINLAAGPGVAVREAMLKTGEADHFLFAADKAIATVEAKPEGHTLTGVEEQSGRYGKGLLDIYPSWGDPSHLPMKAPVPKRDSRIALTPIPRVAACSHFTGPRHSLSKHRYRISVKNA
jgi:type I site-specific restriction endonuclease